MLKKVFPSLLLSSLLITPCYYLNATPLQQHVHKDVKQETVLPAIPTTPSQFAALGVQAVLHSVTGKIKSAITSSLFGSGSSDVVNLSEASFQRIEAIVHRQLDQLVRNDTLPDLESIQDSLYTYQGRPDSSRLSQLDQETRHFINRPVFEDDFAEHVFMTETFSTAVALRLVVTQERVNQGLNTDNYLKAVSQQLLDRLTAMKNDTDKYINDNVYSSFHVNDHCTHGSGGHRREPIIKTGTSQCAVYSIKDKIADETLHYKSDGESAMNALKKRRNQYKDSFEGDQIDTIMSTLEETINE